MLAECDRCAAPVDAVGVCGSCGRHTPLSATERVATLTSSFDERDEDLVGGDPIRFEGYANDAYAARVHTGMSEAAVWGWSEIGGSRCALVVLDFSFLGGSMGVAVGEKVARAYDAATSERLPLAVVTASGGARMQEGMMSLAQMAKVMEAHRRHARAHLGQVTVMTSPTTGGVLASFASAGDVLLAEPGVHIGFAGPRVAQLATGVAPPPGVYTPELHLERGLLDAIVPRGDLPSVVGRALRSLAGSAREPLPRKPRAIAGRSSPSPTAWERLHIARAADRPKGPEILDRILIDWTELHGDRAAGEDPCVVARIGALASSGAPVVAVAEDASAGRIGPAGYRKAVRALELAGRLRQPVVTIIDSPGADPGPESEAGGVAAAIAATLEAMLDCPSPTLAVLTGEGGSGGAFALAPADRVLAWEHAIFSVISPEAAAAILHRAGAEELAESLRITTGDLLRLGLVDTVLPEPAGGAQLDRDSALEMLSVEVAAQIAALARRAGAGRLASRRRRWRGAGSRYLRES